MPVPTQITDLTTVAATNSPPGTESAKGTVDDYFRAHAAFIRQLYDQTLGPSAVLASAATLNIGFAGALNVIVTGTTTITSFDNVAEGTLRWLVFSGSLTITHNAAAIVLPGSVNITTAFGDAALFKSTGGGRWICLTYQNAAETTTPRLALTGGTMSGNAIFNNSVGIHLKDTGGTPRQFVNLGADNNVNFTVCGGGQMNYYNQAGTVVVASLSNTGTFTAVSVGQTSDERKKCNWKPLTDAQLDALANMKHSGTFEWVDGNGPSVGGSAQEIQSIVPEAVFVADDEQQSLTVNYGGLNFAILQAMLRRQKAEK